MKITAAYIPVIHKGHQQFFRKVKPDVLYVLGTSFRKDFKLDRDLRALEPEEIVIMCRAFNFAPDIKILELNDIEILTKVGSLVFPDDEVMRSIADTYLAGVPVTFEKIFLRWDKMAALTANPVTPDIMISKNDFDREVMGQAMINANKSSEWWRQIGAVIVKDGTIILEGFNQHKPSEQAPYIDGDPRSNFDAGEPLSVYTYTSLHAEAGLISRAANQGIALKNSSIYVSTFSCPNCAKQIVEAGITKLYYAGGYSNLGALDNLKAAGIKIIQVKI